MADIMQLEQALIKADQAGNVEDAKAFAAEIRRLRSQQQEQSAQQEEPTAYDKFSRALGLTGRAALEGAGDVVGIVGNPLAAITGARRPSEIASQFATDIGLPSPETETEQLVNIAGRGIAGAGGVIGAGSQLGRIPGALGQFGELLSAQPASQAAAALGGAGGAEVASQSNIEGSAAMIPAVLGATTAQGLAGLAQRVPAMARSAPQQFVVPPSQTANPTALARGLETLSGKAKTEQYASAKNQQLTNKLVIQDLGMPKDTKLSPEMLKSYRSKVYDEGYKPIAESGIVKPSDQLQNELIEIARPHSNLLKDFPDTKASADVLKAAKELFDATNKEYNASNALVKIKSLRESATKAYKEGDSSLGKAYKDMSNAMESQLERHLAEKGTPATVAAFKNARQNIAKSHSIEESLVPSGEDTFNVSAQKLARLKAGGTPLVGNLERVARQAAATPKSMTVPVAGATSPYTLTDIGYGGGAGIGGASLAALTGGSVPLGLAAGLAIPAARPVARGAVLSQPFQRGMMETIDQNRLSSILYPAMEVNQ